ncbi:MAG: DUF503 domain-containing protein [Dehalococcoidales bacterium]|jgi:uncharacterized protein YlxP (DUF503 family)|nr:DUF503 domain-containing protein [Dehalococcoidales bacterium]
MNVGVCKLQLKLAEGMSLKGKRQVIKPIIALIKNKYNVSIAEVENNDLWQIATLGICFISNDSKYTDEVITSIINFISSGRFEVEIISQEVEIIPF